MNIGRHVYNVATETDQYYKKLDKAIKKYKRYYTKGKGKKPTTEEINYIKNYIKDVLIKEDNENFKLLLQQIESEEALDEPDFLNTLLDEGDTNNTSDTTSDTYEDIDYSNYNISNSRNITYNPNKKIPNKIYKYCEELTAKQFSFNPAVGREKELEELMLTILTPNKSAVLIGNPGVGKTAIIEGLAYNIQRNTVPAALKDYTIFQTSATILNSNCSLNGMLEKRVLELFQILSKQEKVILFIDEIHTLVGAGISIEGKSLDIANIIKPFLTSNDICLIGATTINEYDELMGSDLAFQRRFNPIMIEEPDNKTLEIILLHTIEKYSKNYNIKVNTDLSYYIAKLLVNNTIKSKRNYDDYLYNPDLAITIIASAFGYVRLYDRKELTIEDIAKAYSFSQRVKGDLIYDKSYSSKRKNINKLDKKIIQVKFK